MMKKKTMMQMNQVEKIQIINKDDSWAIFNII